MPTSTSSLIPLEAGTSTSLVRQVRLHDEDAWRRMVRLYGPTVYGWCRKRGLSEDDSADIVQSVFLAVSSSIEKFRRDRESDTFRGWLWVVTLNAIRDFARQNEDTPDARGGTTGNVRIQQFPDAASLTSEELSDVGPARSELSHLCRRALELIRPRIEPQVWESFSRTAIHGDRAADVAADLGISVSSVYKSKTRVLKRLQRELADD